MLKHHDFVWFVFFFGWEVKNGTVDNRISRSSASRWKGGCRNLCKDPCMNKRQQTSLFDRCLTVKVCRDKGAIHLLYVYIYMPWEGTCFCLKPFIDSNTSWLRRLCIRSLDAHCILLFFVMAVAIITLGLPMATSCKVLHCAVLLLIFCQYVQWTSLQHSVCVFDKASTCSILF